MASAWKHPKTGKWRYRKAVPPDLNAKHKELAAMGIKVQLYEVRHTLNASSNVDAERKWNKANEACLLRFEAMRNALAKGPSSLTQRQVAALAGDIARQVLGSDADLSDVVMPDPAKVGKLQVSWEQSIELFKLIEVHGLGRYTELFCK